MKINISSLAKGITIGMAVGAATYALTNATKKDKRMLKSNTGKAIKAIGEVFEDFGTMF